VYGPANAPFTPLSVASLEYGMVYLSVAGLNHVVVAFVVVVVVVVVVVYVL